MDRRTARTRRSGKDRRQGERRGASQAVARAAWSGPNRRVADRRRLAERRLMFDRRLRRRRDTPIPYTAEEVIRIQRMFHTPGHRGTCPACAGSFVLSPERHRGADRVRKVSCSSCGKAAVVSNTWIARVLVVAGTEAIRSGVRSMLASAGHDVTDAGDVEGALRSYGASPADVVIVDLSAAAVLDGQDAIRQLRAKFPDATVLAMSPRTSYGLADPLAAARQFGAVRTVRMPFSASELLAVISEARRESSLA